MERIINNHPSQDSHSAAAILIDLMASRYLVEGRQLGYLPAPPARTTR
jgi:hypothetical protein